MKATGLLAIVSAAAAVAADGPSHVFANPADSAGIPSSYASAVMGRRILAMSKLATLSTVFPEDQPPSPSHEGEVARLQGGAEGLGRVPIGLMDYVADCEHDGNPTVLVIGIATTFRNVRAGSNITASMRWAPPFPPSKRISLLARIQAGVSFLSGSSSSSSPLRDTVPYSAANLPRFSLFGYLEPIEPDDEASARLGACFTQKHRDARYWLPGNRIHDSEWARLVVTRVYWVGGFGDRAYIGWIPAEEWKKVTAEEWTSIKLPGEEEGWSEWSDGDWGEL